MTDITVRTATLPNALVGVAYEAGIAETGAVTAITACTVTSGSLPPGLAISAELVRITGTPTKSGTYTFKVTLTDTAGAVQSGTLTITVAVAADDLPGDILTQPVAAQLARTWH
jgi:hypothetical protein